MKRTPSLQYPRLSPLTGLIASLILAASTITTHATIFYVNGSGGSDGNNGLSPTSAFATVDRGILQLNNAGPGNTLLIAGNHTYVEIPRALTVAGTSSTPTLIDAYNTGGNQALNPKIQGQGNTGQLSNDFGLHLQNCKFVTVRNIQVYNNYQYGIAVDGDSVNHTTIASTDNVVEFCSSDNTGKSGIAAHDGSNITIRYSTVTHAVQWQSQECITMNNITGPWVYGCTVSTPGTPANGGEGIDFKVGSNSGAMHDNVVNGIQRLNLYVDSGSLTQSAHDIDIYRNLSIAGGGCGIDVATEIGSGTTVTSNVRIFNNVVSGNGGGGLSFGVSGNGPSHLVNNVHAYHNTIDSCHDGVYFTNSSFTNLTLQYNIITNPSAQKVYLLTGWNNVNDSGYPSNMPSGIVAFNNVVYGGTGWEGQQNGTHVAASNIHSDPLYSGTGTVPATLRIQSGSPAIGLDTDTNAAFVTDDFRAQSRGSSRDAGAFQSISGTLVFEAEKLDVPNYYTAHNGAVRNLGPDSNLSNSDGIIMDSADVGDYLTFALPAISNGRYNVYVKWKGGNNRGKFSLAGSISGGGTYTNITTSDQDEYSSGMSYPAEVFVGQFFPGSTSDKWFKFTITGKNASSSSYGLTIDYIKLVPF